MGWEGVEAYRGTEREKEAKEFRKEVKTMRVPQKLGVFKGVTFKYVTQQLDARFGAYA